MLEEAAPEAKALLEALALWEALRLSLLEALVLAEVLAMAAVLASIKTNERSTRGQGTRIISAVRSPTPA